MFSRLRSMLAAKPVLGPLESELLHLLFARGDATVRELLDHGLDAAYTTVMTTLDRLYKKGLLDRTREGKAFRYRPLQTKEEYDRDTVAQGLGAILDHPAGTSLPISLLVDAVSQRDPAALDELARAVEQKRRALQRKETGP